MNLGLASRFFSDLRHGGKEASRLAAEEFRAQMLATEHVTALPVSKSKHSRNTTGIVGIAWQQDKRRAEDDGAWLCYWSEGGKQRKMSFGVMKYGFLGAWEMALQARMSHADVLPTKAQIESARMKLEDFQKREMK